MKKTIFIVNDIGKIYNFFLLFSAFSISLLVYIIDFVYNESNANVNAS